MIVNLPHTTMKLLSSQILPWEVLKPENRKVNKLSQPTNKVPQTKNIQTRKHYYLPWIEIPLCVPEKVT